MFTRPSVSRVGLLAAQPGMSIVGFENTGVERVVINLYFSELLQ